MGKQADIMTAGEDQREVLQDSGPRGALEISKSVGISLRKCRGVLGQEDDPPTLTETHLVSTNPHKHEFFSSLVDGQQEGRGHCVCGL